MLRLSAFSNLICHAMCGTLLMVPISLDKIQLLQKVVSRVPVPVRKRECVSMISLNCEG